MPRAKLLSPSYSSLRAVICAANRVLSYVMSHAARFAEVTSLSFAQVHPRILDLTQQEDISVAWQNRLSHVITVERNGREAAEVTGSVQLQPWEILPCLANEMFVGVSR